jgi:hypothetical protein
MDREQTLRHSAQLTKCSCAISDVIQAEESRHRRDGGVAKWKSRHVARDSAPSAAHGSPKHARAYIGGNRRSPEMPLKPLEQHSATRGKINDNPCARELLHE